MLDRPATTTFPPSMPAVSATASRSLLRTRSNCCNSVKLPPASHGGEFPRHGKQQHLPNSQHLGRWKLEIHPHGPINWILETPHLCVDVYRVPGEGQDVFSGVEQYRLWSLTSHLLGRGIFEQAGDEVPERVASHHPLDQVKHRSQIKIKSNHSPG